MSVISLELCGLFSRCLLRILDVSRVGEVFRRGAVESHLLVRPVQMSALDVLTTIKTLLQPSKRPSLWAPVMSSETVLSSFAS